MTSFLAIGDPHFQVKNIPDVNQFIYKVKDIAKNRKPDFIVILGDVLHTHERLHTTPLNKAYEFVEAMRDIAPTYVLVGNHDYIQNQQFLTTNHWMNSMKEWEGVTIVDTVVYSRHGDKDFFFCPYVPPGRFEEALATYKGIEDWKTSDVIFAHQEFFGCKMGAFDSVEGDKWSLDNPNVVSGHIHDRQQPQENIYYTGSSIQHAFGESGNKTILLQTHNGETVEREDIPLGLSQKKIVYLSVDDIDEYKIKESNDQLKLTVSGSYDEFKALKKTKKYKQILEGGTKIVFKPKKADVEKASKVITDSSHFNSILSDIVLSQEDPHLLQAYEIIVNNKEVTDIDVLFL